MAEKSTRVPRRRKRLLIAGLLAATGTAAVTALLVGATEPPTVPYDFNGDGIAELTIGMPGNVVHGHNAAGSLVIADGTSDGPASTSVRIDQETPGVPGNAENDDAFGHSMASGDFDDDGFADLAVGSPVEDLTAADAAGFLTIHYGSADGLHGSRTDSFYEGGSGIPGSGSKDDLFSYSLAVGDLNSDGYSDLAVGQPLDRVEGDADAGSALVLFGSSSGLSSDSAMRVSQETSHVPGTPEPGDRFAEQLAVADIDADGADDLIVATIGEQVSGYSDRGSIHVLYGPLEGPPERGGYLDSAHVDGIGAFAGSALAVGRFNGDEYADIAVGVSDQKVGDDGAAGALAVFYGDADGVSHERVEVVHQDSPGITGAPEAEDYFAASLAAGDFDGDGVDDLIVGMRSEAIGSDDAAGAALVLFGNENGGLAATGSVWIDQESEGVPGIAVDNDHFGWTVGTQDTDGDGRAEPLIGAPGNSAGTVTVMKVARNSIQSATALAEGDLGWPDGEQGDAFGSTLPR